MSRRIPLRSSLLRPFLLARTSTPHNPLSLSRLLLTPPLATPTPPTSPFTRRLSPTSLLSPRRHFASDSGSENLILIKTEEGLNTAFSKAKDEKLPSVFYFTATWCGPCRVISPIIEELSEEFSHVTIYKIDIDQETLASMLSNLKIYAVPTLHFYQNGRKATEMTGSNGNRTRFTMNELYKENGV